VPSPSFDSSEILSSLLEAIYLQIDSPAGFQRNCFHKYAPGKNSGRGSATIFLDIPNPGDGTNEHSRLLPAAWASGTINSSTSAILKLSSFLLITSRTPKTFYYDEKHPNMEPVCNHVASLIFM
jgi:hypothetical protein